MTVRFISQNEHKIREVRALLEGSLISVVAIFERIEEIQTEDNHKLVRDKILKAFTRIGKPVFVEHTGLHIDSLNGFPGGLTQIFWDALGADRFCEIFGSQATVGVAAVTTIAYCDGVSVKYFEGKIRGTIPSIPRGCRDFQWDCAFIPDGFDKSFAEMGEDKNLISMRKIAFEKFKDSIK